MHNSNKDNVHSKIVYEATFSYNSLAVLIQQYGLIISKNSPLYVLVEEEIETDIIKEMDTKFNDSNWKNALIALCSPDFKQTSFTIYPGSIIAITYCINQRYFNIIAACQLLGDNQIKVSFPYEPNDILTDCCNTMQINNAVYSGGRKLEVSPEGLLALFAALDSIKEVLLISLLTRQYISDFKLPNNQLSLTLASSLKDKRNDNRWLVTLIRLFDAELHSEEALTVTQSAFDELLSLGLIVDEESGYWTPSPELMDIASNFLTPLPAFYQEGVLISSNNVTTESNSLTLRGTNSICLIDFGKNTQTKKNISLNWLNKNEYWLEMMGRFTPPKPNVEPTPVKEKSSQVSQDHIQEIFICPVCGTELKTGARFCTHCGAPVPAEEISSPIVEKETSEVKKCQNCGAELKPGAKFCTQCGAKV